MTFVNLQDRVMDRGNRTSSESRDRVKTFLNERLRSLQSSVGLGHLRRGTVSLNTTGGTATLTTTGLVKVFTVTLPALNTVLREVSLDTIRVKDPSSSSSGAPQEYAVKSVGATSLVLMLWPEPDAAYALSVDGLLVGTDMSADGDVPGMPEDFHDTLVFGALADEYDHDGDTKMALRMETRFESRKRELRYFLAKSAYKRDKANNYEPYPWWYVQVV
jgi:hypothetical protein